MLCHYASYVDFTELFSYEIEAHAYLIMIFHIAIDMRYVIYSFDDTEYFTLYHFPSSLSSFLSLLRYYKATIAPF